MFERELTDALRRVMDEEFWVSYNAVIEDAKKVARDRTAQYNRYCSVVDYFPDGPLSSLWIVHTKCLRLEQALRTLDDGSFASSDDMDDLQETVRDLINYVAYVYAGSRAEWKRLRKKP